MGVRIHHIVGCLSAALLACISLPSRDAAALGTGFTYQGQLVQSGVPTTGPCDFLFSLWDAAGSGAPPTGGTQIGGLQSVSAVTVSNGVFTVQLNSGGEFGASAFDGNARWLQMAVRCLRGIGSFSDAFSPRQPLTAAPYAQKAGALAPGAVTTPRFVDNGDGTGHGHQDTTDVGEEDHRRQRA